MKKIVMGKNAKSLVVYNYAQNSQKKEINKYTPN